MMEPLLALTLWGQGTLVALAAVFFRVGAAMAVLPAFGERSVPMRVRLGLSLAFTLLVAPAISVTTVPDTPLSWFSLIASESLCGLVFGMMLRLMVLALQIAGSIAAQSTSLAQIFGGTASEPMPAIGHVLVIGGLALAVMMDLHVHLTRALIESYAIFPPGHLLQSEGLATLGVQRVGQAFALAFSLAAPFVIAALVYNLALGAINRAMPQLMVAFVGAPAITGAGLALLALSAPAMFELWLGALERVLIAPFGV